MVYFFKTTCYDIFKHLLAISSQDRDFFSLIFIYFGIVEINSQEILHLHYLIWLYIIFYIF